MKSLLIFAFTLLSASSYAGFEYSCDLYPGEEGGNTFLIKVNGNKAKVYSTNFSEEDRSIDYVTTLNEVSVRNSPIKHFAENDNGKGIEFFIRRDAGSIGRTDHRTNKFRVYGCTEEE